MEYQCTELALLWPRGYCPVCQKCPETWDHLFSYQATRACEYQANTVQELRRRLEVDKSLQSWYQWSEWHHFNAQITRDQHSIGLLRDLGFGSKNKELPITKAHKMAESIKEDYSGSWLSISP
jgi:4-alpha-glucanotransferase